MKNFERKIPPQPSQEISESTNLRELTLQIKLSKITQTQIKEMQNYLETIKKLVAQMVIMKVFRIQMIRLLTLYQVLRDKFYLMKVFKNQIITFKTRLKSAVSDFQIHQTDLSSSSTYSPKIN